MTRAFYLARNASMRPRHYCRGRSLVSTRTVTMLPLGFNEAAALLPRKMAVQIQVKVTIDVALQ